MDRHETKVYSVDDMETDGENRNNVSNLFPHPDGAQLDSLEAFTDQQLQSLRIQLPDVQEHLAQLNLDERRQPARVVGALRGSQQSEEVVLASLRQAGRDDIVGVLRPNNVVSMRGAEAAAISLPLQSATDKKRFPRGSLFKNLPYEIRHEFQQRLGVENPSGNDYRSFGAKIGLQRHTLSLLKEDALSRGEHVMTEFVQRRGRQATLENLYAILKELGLTDVLEFLESHMEQN